MSSILFYSTRLRKNWKKNRFFFEMLKKILVSRKSHSAETCKMGPFASFLTSILLQNRQKKWRVDPLEIFAKKVSQSRKKFAQKILVMAGLEPMSFCLSDLEKAVVDRWQWSSVTQFSVSVVLVPTYKIYKICQFVGLKKSHYYSLHFSSKSAD